MRCRVQGRDGALPARTGATASAVSGLKSGSNQSGDLLGSTAASFISKNYCARARQPGSISSAALGAPIVTTKLFAFAGITASRTATRRHNQLRADRRDAGRRLIRLPACTGSVQRRDRWLSTAHRPVEDGPGGAELPEARRCPPICGKLQWHPEQQRRASGPGQGRLHDQLELVAVRALLTRLTQPGDLRQHQRRRSAARARTTNCTRSSRAQPGAVGVDAQLAARDDQQDAERSAAAAVFQRNESGSRCPAWCPVHGRDGRETASRWRRRQTQVLNSTGFQIADDVDLVRGAHQLSIGGNWIRSRIETVSNRPTNGRSRSTNRRQVCRWPISWSAR